MQIANYKEMNPNSGSVIAEFSAVGEKVTYHRLKLMRSKKGHLYIAYPSFKENRDDPASPWIQFVEMHIETKKDFEKKLREALEPYLRTGVSFL